MNVSPGMIRYGALLLTLLAFPSAAAARHRVIAPPGVSGISQYVENVPTAGGGQPSSTVMPGRGNLPPATQRTLAGSGADGRATAALAGATGPGRVRQHGSRSLPPAGDGSSAISALLRAVTGSSSGGGLGPLLPAALILATVCAATAVLLRRRRAG